MAQQDPLFLQVKEATASVLEDHLPKSKFSQHGERVVQGQRLMQAASDIYLGWSRGAEEDRYLYWRQLRDMKGSALVETMTPVGLGFYAGLCGWTLARAHARSGDAVALAAYLGESDDFDQSITEFSADYADQNERDYQAFTEAIQSGSAGGHRRCLRWALLQSPGLVRRVRRCLSGRSRPCMAAAVSYHGTRPNAPVVVPRLPLLLAPLGQEPPVRG